MKRILVLALALIVAVGSLAVPSYAAEVVPEAIVDLKYGVEYFLYQNDSLYTSKASPYEWFPNLTKFRADWNISNSVSFRTIRVGIIADRVPDAVYIGNSSPGKAYCAYDRSVGNVHYFQTWEFLDITQSIQVHADFNSQYTGWVGVDSIFGLYSDSIDIDKVNYFSNAFLYDTDVEDEAGSFARIQSIESETNYSLPAVAEYSGPTGNDLYHLHHGEMFVKVPYSSHNLDLASSVTYLIYSAGEIYDVGARLEDSSGNILANLDFTVSGGGESQIVWSSYENIHRLKVYTVTVDLTGYELRGKNISFSYNIDRVFSSYVYQYDYGYYTQVTGIAISKMSSDTPWYSLFALWLKGQYNSIKNSISSGFNSVVSGLTAVDNSIRNWLSTVNQTITNGFNRLADFLGASGDNQQFEDDVGQQGDKLDDMEQVMDSVTKPALDSINVDPGSFVNQSDVHLLVSPIAVIYDVPIFKTILLMSIMMATAGYVLFGKR